MKLYIVDYFIKNMEDTISMFIPIESFYSIPLIFSLRLDAYDFSIVLFVVGKKCDIEIIQKTITDTKKYYSK